MKCWPEFERHRHIYLNGPENIAFLQNEGKPAWKRFLLLAKDPDSVQVYLGGRLTQVTGCALVWCGITAQGRTWALETLGLREVFALEDMINDLITWDAPVYGEYLQERADWCRDFFLALRTRPTVTSGE